nr:uncharacterized protein LOC105844503 [Hydra vulgaris]
MANDYKVNGFQKSKVRFSDDEEIKIDSENENERLVGKTRSLSYVRPRMASVFFMVDSSFAGGIISRSNYMTRCFMYAWEKNKGDITRLYMLLWNGESSRQTMWKAVLGLLLQFLVALIPVFLFFKNFQIPSIKWIFFFVELLSLAWHVFVGSVLIHNKRYWEMSWFTFKVPLGTIGLVDSGVSNELTLFHSSANIRFTKTSYSEIWRLHTLSYTEQNVIKENMKQRGLDECEIILYTDSFINCYSTWAIKMASALFLCSCVGFIIVLKFCIQ